MTSHRGTTSCTPSGRHHVYIYTKLNAENCSFQLLVPCDNMTVDFDYTIRITCPKPKKNTMFFFNAAVVAK